MMCTLNPTPNPRPPLHPQGLLPKALVAKELRIELMQALGPAELAPPLRLLAAVHLLELVRQRGRIGGPHSVAQVAVCQRRPNTVGPSPLRLPASLPLSDPSSTTPLNSVHTAGELGIQVHAALRPSYTHAGG